MHRVRAGVFVDCGSEKMIALVLLVALGLALAEQATGRASARRRASAEWKQINKETRR